MSMKIFAALFLLCGMAAGQAKSDYFIIANPLDYTIYNQYEQPISDAEKTRFPPFTPLRVIAPDVTLGDQITHACKCGFGQETFFLILEENGKFVGEKSKSGRQVARNCEPMEDTIEVVKSGLHISSPSGKTAAIAAGSRVNRVFRSGGRYYVVSLSDRAFYGWSRLEPNGAWRKIEGKQAARIASDTVLSENVRERVMERLNAANESYKAAFSHFNRVSGNEKAVPRWRCDMSGMSMRCELTGAYENGGQLAESTALLLRDLENILLGTDFRPLMRDNAIVIEPRKAGN